MTTKSTMHWPNLPKRGADADLLREMIRHFAQRMMEMDVESLCAAAYGERSLERINNRNGYRERQLQRRYLPLEGLLPLADNQPARRSAVVS